MQEIQPSTVQIKVSDGNEDKFILVHDGKRVIVLAEPGSRVATGMSNQMLVGTKEELQAEIQRLGLQPATPPSTDPPADEPT